MRIQSVLALSSIMAAAVAAGCDDSPTTGNELFGIQLEAVATCPNGFTLQAVGTYTQYTQADRNGDGYCCVKRVAGCDKDFPACGLHMVAIIDNNVPSHGDCLAGYDAVGAIEQPDADQNGDQIVCKTVSGQTIYTDNSF